jgi:hypothetical protein
LMLFGGHPMFFYVIHIALTHFLGGLYMQLRFGAQAQLVGGNFKLPDAYEASLPVVYAAWLGVLALMYGLTLLWSRRRT